MTTIDIVESITRMAAIVRRFGQVRVFIVSSFHRFASYSPRVPSVRIAHAGHPRRALPTIGPVGVWTRVVTRASHAKTPAMLRESVSPTGCDLSAAWTD